MSGTILICPVRDCRAPLLRELRRVACRRGHSFDIARSGYINLLQPQDKKSKEPGDTPAAVMGRRRIHDLGVTAPLLTAIADLAAVSPGDVILDAGCGEGFYLGNLPGRRHGTDLSIPAIDAAARRYPDCQWTVANADRFLPYGDASFSLVLSITARQNSSEFRRVLNPQGRLLIALPAPDDLIEVRGKGREDRVARTLETFADAFEPLEQRRITTQADLDASAVTDLRHSIYRPLHAQPATAMTITFSLDLLLMKIR